MSMFSSKFVIVWTVHKANTATVHVFEKQTGSLSSWLYICAVLLFLLHFFLLFNCCNIQKLLSWVQHETEPMVCKTAALFTSGTWLCPLTPTVCMEAHARPQSAWTSITDTKQKAWIAQNWSLWFNHVPIFVYFAGRWKYYNHELPQAWRNITFFDHIAQLWSHNSPPESKCVS